MLGAAMPTAVIADEFDEFMEETDSDVSLIKGELISVNVSNLTRVSVTDPEIADIVDASADELMVIGKTVGQTALFVWDDSGKRTIMIYVVNQNLSVMKDRIRKLVDAAGIKDVQLAANGQEGKVVISGKVPREKEELFDAITEQFADDIIVLVEEEKSQDLVQVDMQITELNTSLSKSLGVDWLTDLDEDSNSGGDASSGITVEYDESVPSADGGIGDFFKIGNFRRTGQLIAKVNALITEGKGRILSKPKLVVISGEEASFLVGGEIPIRTTTSSDTGTQENVEFKEFGISMTITPTIRDARVDIIMNLEVSEIDASTADTIDDDIAFSTRSANTHLFLDDGQTIILAGLIKHSDSTTYKKVPFAGDIPILGLLFRSRSDPVADTEQELVIAMTPHIISQTRTTKPSQVSEGAQSPDGYAMSRSRRYNYQRPAPYYLGVPREMTSYVHDVQKQISQSIVYPQEAQRYGWEGTVRVGMLILNDGTLAYALVKEPSGHDVFDEVALNTAKRLAPFSAFPTETDLQELNVTIPIVYSLNDE